MPRRVKKQAFLIIDLEATQTRAYLLDMKGQLCRESTVVLGTEPGPKSWRQYDPFQLLYSCRSAIHGLFQTKAWQVSHVVGIGILGRGYASLAWEPKTGRVLCPAIMKQPGQFKLRQRQLKSAQLDQHIYQVSGVAFSDQMDALLWSWMSQEVEEVSVAKKQGRCCFGTVESWILYNLSGTEASALDMSLAQQTGLFNMEKGAWDSLLLAEFGLSAQCLPGIYQGENSPSTTRRFVSLPDGIPIVVLSHVDQAKAVGNRLFHLGDAMLTVASNQSRLFVQSGSGFLCQEPLSRVPFSVFQDPSYLVMGDQRLPKWPSFLSKGTLFDQSDLLASVSFDMVAKVVFRAQKDKNVFGDIKMDLIGISDQTQIEEIAQSYLETLVYLMKQLVVNIEKEMGVLLKGLVVEGPFLEVKVVMQFLADILQFPLISYDQFSSEILGMAAMMAQRVGVVSDVSEYLRYVKVREQVLPVMDPISSFARFHQWESQAWVT